MSAQKKNENHLNLSKEKLSASDNTRMDSHRSQDDQTADTARSRERQETPGKALPAPKGCQRTGARSLLGRDPSGSSTYPAGALCLRKPKFGTREPKITRGEASCLAGLEELGLFTPRGGWLLPTYTRVRDEAPARELQKTTPAKENRRELA